MGRTIRIAAVGDVLMWKNQIASAANGKGGYHFDKMFSSVAPVLRGADFTIGNLETTLSGRETIYQRRNPKTGYPRFNCPDELAASLKRAGFHVLTTANNHCMDRGERGLLRTLRTLNQAGIQHTGTYASKDSSQKFLIHSVKGIKIGVLSYTYGTNYIPVPKNKPWLVNRISIPKITSDLRRLHNLCDIVIVAMHFGQEFQRMPNARQKQLVKVLLKNGADIILGAHPHVLQPVNIRTVTDRWGVTKKRVVAYSLGNFISDRMLGNSYADIGMILRISVERSEAGKVRLRQIGYMPTWVSRIRRGQGYTFKVLPTNSYKAMKDKTNKGMKDKTNEAVTSKTNKGLSDKTSLRNYLERIHRQTLIHLQKSI